MKMPKRQALAGLVPHPRYGTDPIKSGISVPEDEIRLGHWQYSDAVLFPESVLAADVSKQNYALYPRRYYVDLLRHCRTCSRLFIFFAREQKHWFETLVFYVDADCIACPECRKGSQAMHKRLRRYSDLVKIEHPTRKELMQLVDDTIYLLEREVLKNASRIGAIKNIALAEIPEYGGTQALVKALDLARSGQHAP